MADEVFRVGSVRVFHPNPQQPPSPLEACIITRPRENTWVLGLELRDQQFAVVYDGLADRHQEQMGTRIEDATSQSTDDNPDPILTVAYECLRQLMPLDLLPLAGSRPLSKLITTPTIYLQMWSNGATASAEPPFGGPSTTIDRTLPVFEVDRDITDGRILRKDHLQTTFFCVLPDRTPAVGRVRMEGEMFGHGVVARHMAALIRLRNHRHHLGACHEARIPEITGLIRHGKRGIVGFVTRRVLGRPLDEYDIYHRDIDHRVKWFAQITASVTKLHHCSITWGTREPSDLGGFIIEDRTNDVWLMDYGAGWPPGPQELPSDVVLRERAQLDSLRDEMDVVPHNRQPDSRPVSR